MPWPPAHKAAGPEGWSSSAAGVCRDGHPASPSTSRRASLRPAGSGWRERGMSRTLPGHEVGDGGHALALETEQCAVPEAEMQACQRSLDCMPSGRTAPATVKRRRPTLGQQDIGRHADAVGRGAVGREVAQADGAHARRGVRLAVVGGSDDQGAVDDLRVGLLVDLQLVVAPACARWRGCACAGSVGRCRADSCGSHQLLRWGPGSHGW